VLQHPVPEPILARIGDITVSFALLESMLQSLAGLLLGCDQRTQQIVTAEISFQQLCKLVVSIGRERYVGEDAKRLDDLVTGALKLADRRNAITHSLWAAGSTRDEVNRVKVTAKKAKGFNIDSEQITVEALAAVAADMCQRAHDMQTFWIKHIDHAGNDHTHPAGRHDADHATSLTPDPESAGPSTTS
jgi:hypothetical protein